MAISTRNTVRYAHSDAPQLRCSALVSTALGGKNCLINIHTFVKNTDH